MREQPHGAEADGFVSGVNALCDRMEESCETLNLTLNRQQMIAIAHNAWRLQLDGDMAHEALYRAMVNGATNVVAYVISLMREWARRAIYTVGDLEDYEIAYELSKPDHWSCDLGEALKQFDGMYSERQKRHDELMKSMEG